MNVSVVLFTSDLRLHDHPPLRAALDGHGRWCRCSCATGPWTPPGSPRRTGWPSSPTACATSTPGCASGAAGWSCAPATLVDEVCKVAGEADADEVHMAADVSALRPAPRGAAARGPGGAGRAAARARRGDHGGRVPARWSRLLGPLRRVHAVLPALVAAAAADPARGARPVRVPDGVGSQLLPSRGDLSGTVAGAGRRRRDAGTRAVRPWLRAGVDRVRGPARRPGGRRHLTALPPPALRHAVPGGTRPPGAPGGRSGRRGLRTAARLARLPPSGAGGPPRAAARRLPHQHDRWRSERTAPRTSRHGGRAAPATRSSTRRCGSCATRAGCTTAGGC